MDDMPHENEHLDSQDRNPRQTALLYDLRHLLMRHTKENDLTYVDLLGCLEVLNGEVIEHLRESFNRENGEYGKQEESDG